MNVEPLVNRVEIISEPGFKADGHAFHNRIIESQANRTLVIYLINIPGCSE